MDKQKILIVDDSEMNRALLIDILEEHYDVVEAENGVEAISLLSKQRADFSLLLLDIMMPEMDGFEVLASPVEGEKILALLTYMLDHNVHHCAELKELGASLTGEAAHHLFHAVESFDAANSHLAAAIEELKK